jgi:hypothetical protein
MISDEARRRGPGYALGVALSDATGVYGITIHSTTELPDGRVSEAIAVKLGDGTDLALDVRFATEEEL